MSVRRLLGNQKGLSVVDTLIGLAATAMIFTSVVTIFQYSARSSSESQIQSEIESITDRIENTILKEPSCSRNFAKVIQFKDVSNAVSPFQLNVPVPLNAASISAFEQLGGGNYSLRVEFVTQKGDFVEVTGATATLLSASKIPNKDQYLGQVEITITFQSLEAEQKIKSKVFGMNPWLSNVAYAGGGGGYVPDPNGGSGGGGSSGGGWIKFKKASRTYVRKLGMIVEMNESGFVTGCRTNDRNSDNKICDVQDKDFVPTDQGGTCQSREELRREWYQWGGEAHRYEAKCADGWTWNGQTRILVKNSLGQYVDVKPGGDHFFTEWNKIADPIMSDYGNGPIQVGLMYPWALNGVKTDPEGAHWVELKFKYNEEMSALPGYDTWGPEFVASMQCEKYFPRTTQ